MSKQPRPKILGANSATAAFVEPQPVQATPALAPSGAKRTGSRTGKKAIYTFMEPAEHRLLKLMSLDTGKTIDAIVTEAIRAHLAAASYKLPD